VMVLPVDDRRSHILVIAVEDEVDVEVEADTLSSEVEAVGDEEYMHEVLEECTLSHSLFGHSEHSTRLDMEV
jgi:hypothetical protein